MYWRIRHKIAEHLRFLAWRIKGKPEFISIPHYRDYRIVAYEEFKLNDIGLVYIDDELRRTFLLFDTQVA